MYTVKEIAEIFGVSIPGVYLWVRNGLPHKKERIVGRKKRIVIDPKDVVNFLELTNEEEIKYYSKIVKK